MPALAYMLIAVKQGKIEPVSQRLMKHKEVENVHQLYGQWDILVKIRTKTMAELRDFIEKVRKLDGIEGTETLIASDVF